MNDNDVGTVMTVRYIIAWCDDSDDEHGNHDGEHEHDDNGCGHRDDDDHDDDHDGGDDGCGDHDHGDHDHEGADRDSFETGTKRERDGGTTVSRVSPGIRQMIGRP